MRSWQRSRQHRFARRPHERPRRPKNKRRDPLLCKCLVAMGMYYFVDCFDNFNQFIRMSSDQCRLYGPEFVVMYNKLHARIEALCSNTAFSALCDFGSSFVVDWELEGAAENDKAAAAAAEKDKVEEAAEKDEEEEEAAAAAEKEEVPYTDPSCMVDDFQDAQPPFCYCSRHQSIWREYLEN
ncbi:hypothetical protein GBF38_009112 [Nibea albiflora]|uniref:Uncharacterized protein n=1 Tax=Nibea albiflora TaxID=240163 RepID=A0ACB7EV85_NIBAL|nr:hypothetical protein GBF38_009112 [Nibea albiflora]